MPLPFLALALAAPLRAAPLDAVPACAALDEQARARAEALAASEHLYDCCDDTVANCLAEPRPCKLAGRVAGEICRRVADGQPDEIVRRSLQLRATSALPSGPPATIDLAGYPHLGAEDAPVTVVTYVCLRCPYCARLEPKLAEAVTDGPLRDKVKLYVKLFPLKSHPGSSEAALGALAALDQGRYWDFLRVAFDDFDAFSPERLPEWARRVGLDVERWEADRADEATRARLVASKREGLANGVDATPSIFIDGRRYRAQLEIGEIVDVLEEEYDRVTGEER